MTLAGRLEIELDGSRALARIGSSRPLTVARNFLGRTPAEVLQSLPLLFGVCGMAQGVAFVTACEKALGIAATAARRRLRDVLVLSETAREHLLRIAMDWPRFAGSEPDLSFLRRIMALDRRIRGALAPKALALAAAASDDGEVASGAAAEIGDMVETAILGEPIAHWLLRRRPDEMADWAGSGEGPARRALQRLFRAGAMDAGAVPLDALPSIEDADFLAGVLQLLRGDKAGALVARPLWQGRPRESTALARQADHPVVRAQMSEAGFGLGARLIARLLELALLPARLEALAAETGDAPAPDSRFDQGSGTGIAQVEAARGRLVHYVEIAQDRLVGYVVLAPTEWNFHPEGAAARALGSIAVSKRPDIRLLADMTVTAFDPCVEYTVKVS